LKLLIVDDEDTTREGIVEKLPWKDIGIDQVEQADDGINALVVAYELSPDIVLTDVRMPRMDGVEMSFRIREKFPQCKIIFMSGYSDKEYLKCAIKLKAISYIEKPINLLELRSALETAVAVCVEEKRRYENEQELNHRLNAGIPLIRSELALLLTHPAVQTVQLVENLKLACLSLPIGGFYTTLLIKFLWCENYSPLEIHTMRESIPAHLENAYLESGLHGLSGMKSEDILLIHLYADISEKHLMTSDKVHNFCQNLYDDLKGTGRIFICIGKKVQTITNVYYSYNTAVLAFQKAFFRSSGSFVEYDDNNTPPYEFNTQLILTFGELLDNDNMEQSIFLIKRLTSELKGRKAP